VDASAERQISAAEKIGRTADVKIAVAADDARPATS